MGYYVKIVESTATVPARHLYRVYEILCSLNTTHHEQKRGGSFSGGKCNEKWFSWMDKDYPNTCHNAKEIFEQLGFETEFSNNGDLLLVDYDNKTGQEDLFLKSIENYLTGKIVWVGEDAASWTTEFYGDSVIDVEVERLLLGEPKNAGEIMCNLLD